MNISALHAGYEQLEDAIKKLSGSTRSQLFLITRWIDSLHSSNNIQFAKSYLRVLVSTVIQIIPDIDFCGYDPEYLIQAKKNLLLVHRTFPDIFSIEEIQQAETCLEKYNRTLRSYVAALFHDEKIQLENERNIPGKISERERLERYIQYLKQNNHEEYLEYESIASEWDQKIRSDTGCVKVPLLEQSVSGELQDTIIPSGHIAALHLTINHPAKEIEKDFISIGNEFSAFKADQLSIELNRALDAVRSAGNGFIKNYRPQFYDINLSYIDKRFTYTGRSLGLPVAVNLLSVLSTQSMDKYYLLIDGSHIFSGLISSDSTVLPMTEEQVRLKARTVFFSPYRSFILPHDNVSAAEKEIVTLNQKYPHRNLSIISVRSLEDVFNHRNIIKSCPVPMKHRAVKKFQKHRLAFTMGTAMTALIAIMLWVFYLFNIDNNPDHITLKDNQFLIQNKNNQVLWTQKINSPVYISDYKSPNGKSEYQLYAIDDLDHDGKNEVLLGHPRPEKGFSDKIYCYDYLGSPRWTSPVGIAMETTEGKYLNDVFKLWAIAVDTSDKKGEKSIISSASNESYSCVVNQFNNAGKKQSEYLHLGVLNQISIINFGNFLSKTLLLTGTHNGFLQAVAAFLDPNMVGGVSPQEETHLLTYPKLQPAQERMYVRFPKIEHSGALNNMRHPRAFVVEHNDSTITFSVEIEYVPPEFHMPPGATADLIYVFDHSMKPLYMNTTSSFDKLHDWLIKKGAHLPALNQAWKDKVLSQILYWDGDKFVNTPTINKRYLDAIKQKQGNSPYRQK